MTLSAEGSAEVVTVPGDERKALVPILEQGFEGLYLWHSKRTLRGIEVVRGLRLDGEYVGLSMLKMVADGAGYVYYLAVASTHRRQGVGARLLDDAIAGFDRRGVEVVYAAAEEENRASRTLLDSRGFRAVERRETGYQEGGLGAWGLLTRMRVVPGEVLYGRRLRPRPVESPR